MNRRAAAACLLALLLLLPRAAPSQEVRRAVLGGALGVAGGAATTLSLVVARARFQRVYLESLGDLVHWQSIPIVAGPAAGVVFALAGEEVLEGGVRGSLIGLAVGAGGGAGLGALLAREPEWRWAGGVIGGGARPLPRRLLGALPGMAGPAGTGPLPSSAPHRGEAAAVRLRSASWPDRPRRSSPSCSAPAWPSRPARPRSPDPPPHRASARWSACSSSSATRGRRTPRPPRCSRASAPTWRSWAAPAPARLRGGGAGARRHRLPHRAPPARHGGVPRATPPSSWARCGSSPARRPARGTRRNSSWPATTTGGSRPPPRG